MTDQTVALMAVGAVYQLSLGSLWLAGRWAFGRDGAWNWIAGLPSALVIPVTAGLWVALAIAG